MENISCPIRFKTPSLRNNEPRIIDIIDKIKEKVLKPYTDKIKPMVFSPRVYADANENIIIRNLINSDFFQISLNFILE